ncbi:MAG: DUF2905 domain-containing protein [Dethiobacteria bacterium]|jgi:hypothetical protein|nr:DUF2905 domain-containing protein [Bacillota bacterium]
MEALGRILISLGILITVVGGLLLLFSRLGIGRLPGDIYIQKGNFVFYFPLMTGITISIILTLLFSLLRR